MYLVIDTISKESLVVLGEKGRLVGKIVWSSDFNQSEELLVKIDKLLEKGGVERKDLTGVVVVSGPGSYTGIRVGVSTGNALGFALGVPVVGVSYLDGLARYAIGRAADRQSSDHSFALRPSESCEVAALVSSIADKYYYGIYKKRGRRVKMLGEYGNAELREILRKRKNVSCIAGVLNEEQEKKLSSDIFYVPADYSGAGVVKKLTELAGERVEAVKKNSLCEPLYINQVNITVSK